MSILEKSQSQTKCSMYLFSYHFETLVLQNGTKQNSEPVFFLYAFLLVFVSTNLNLITFLLILQECRQMALQKLNFVTEIFANYIITYLSVA